MTRRASILINNFNYEAFVADAIDSALAQTHPEVEVVVVDDGSTDGSRAVIERYGTRIVAVLQENGGQASAFNSGFAHATGDVVFLLDSDDWFLPDKVERVIAALDGSPGAQWCFHPLEHRGGEQPPITGATGAIDARDAIRMGRHHGAYAPATTGLCFESALLAQVLPMPTSFRITADNFLKAVALALAPGVVLDEMLAVQRIHGTNAYTGASASDPRRAAIELEIACELRTRWPDLRRHALHRGMGGLRAMQRSGVSDDAARDAARRFLAGCTPAERTRILLSRLRWKLT